MKEAAMVVVRAYEGKPILKRVLAEDNGFGGVRLCDVDDSDRIIGWPKTDVFLFDEALYSRLKKAFESRPEDTKQIWEDAELFLAEFR